MLITHDPEVAAHADRVFVMRDGELHPQTDETRVPDIAPPDTGPWTEGAT